jgi:acetyltransferase-like isoleucine patch superfamily enzyme
LKTKDKSPFRKKLALAKSILLNFRSEYFLSDILGFIWSLLFRPAGIYASRLVLWRCRGTVKAQTALIGIRSNRLGLIPFSKGIVEIEKKVFFLCEGDVRISHGCRIFVHGELKIGDKTYINPNCHLVVTNGIHIGSNCAISWNFQAIDSDIHQSSATKDVSKPIHIGNHVWIGSNVTVLKGVEIGDGSIIAAGSLVNKNIPPGVLAGGVPAKILKEGVTWK